MIARNAIRFQQQPPSLPPSCHQSFTYLPPSPRAKIPINASTAGIGTFLSTNMFCTGSERREDGKLPLPSSKRRSSERASRCVVVPPVLRRPSSPPFFPSYSSLYAPSLPYQGKAENLFCKPARVSASLSRSLILIFEQASELPRKKR